MLIESTSIPFRTMSFPQERIREEIRKGGVNKIAPVLTKDISFNSLEIESGKKYIFEEEKLFIPIQELELKSSNYKKFQYNLLDKETNKRILEGNFDFSEQVSKSKDLELMIEKNNLKSKIKECNSFYPILIKQNITYDKAKEEIKATCSIYSYKGLNSIEVQNRSHYCFQTFDGCYYITRDLQKTGQ